MSSFQIEVQNLAATEELGRKLGPLLFPGAVIALVGPMGVGKTHFTKAVADGLGVRNPAAVNSPTFVLIQEYPARLPIYHFDAYRLKNWHEFADLGAAEYFAGDGVCIVEWADKVTEAMPAEYLKIEMSRVDEHNRTWVVRAVGLRHSTLLREWICPESQMSPQDYC
jgi:tRNA threonylcarbamoyladenosine biosynthesis protein TsaE